MGAGAVTNVNAAGWRDIFWIQAAFHLATSIGLYFFYNPTRRSEYPRMSLKGYIWACDPIGSLLFICSATLLLLALDWAGGAFAWSDAHVAAPLGIGLGLLILFCMYGKSNRTCHTVLIYMLRILTCRWQSGKAAVMVSWHTPFLKAHPISHCLSSHLPSKDGYSTVPSIV